MNIQLTKRHACALWSLVDSASANDLGLQALAQRLDNKFPEFDEMMDSMIDDFDVLEEEGDQAVKAVVSQLLKGKLPDGYVPEVTLHLDDAAENELREHIASEYSGQRFVKEMEES